VFAFARGRAITCVPRLVATLTPDGSAPLGRAAWGDTRIVLSEAQPLHDVFTGAVLQPTATDGGFTLEAAAIFERFPVALLIPANDPAIPAPPAPPALPA
jgi:maltooligosyltrehalose synthase